MNVWLIIFFTSCFFVFYNYIGYAIPLIFLKLFRKKTTKDISDYFPTVSFIVAAYNEGDFIEKKILNSLTQNYPAEKIEYIFITDGSTDNTNSIVEKYSVRLLFDTARKGKSAALNRAVIYANNDILIFSDANTILNKDAVANIARHYRDKKNGGVAGEKKVIDISGQENTVGAGEGLYWKYESFLKKIDSDFYSVVGAAGELFSLRRNLFEPVADNVILDDFILSLTAAKKGYRIVYEPDAYAMESPSFSIEDEKKRKIRIAAGGFQSIGILSDLLKFWKQPKLSFLYISHRVLRWTLSPICLFVAFLSNGVLFFISGNLFYELFFLLQLCFYGMAVVAIIWEKNKFRFLKLPYYFTFMNVSVVLGFIRFVRGKQSAVWEKAKRKQESVL